MQEAPIAEALLMHGMTADSWQLWQGPGPQASLTRPGP